MVTNSRIAGQLAEKLGRNLCGRLGDEEREHLQRLESGIGLNSLDLVLRIEVSQLGPPPERLQSPESLYSFSIEQSDGGAGQS